MKKELRNILDKVILINQDEDYSQAIFSLFCGVGTTSEYKTLLAKCFVEPVEVYDKLGEVEAENVCVYKISNTEFKVLAFSDGYEGVYFTFGVENGKLKILSSKQIDEDDSLYEKDELGDSEIENILTNI